VRSPTIFALCLTTALGWTSSAAAEKPKQTAAQQDPTRELLAYKDRVLKATVTLPERSCAGSVAGDREHVVTAAHCVTEDATRVRVRFSQGTSQTSSVEFIDRDADLALLRLDTAVAIEPLALADSLPKRGSRVLFVGRIDRQTKAQVARVDRLGRCPSLPGQPQALFTSVQARPGDSGAPLVDSELRVVGVIHGGSSCHIAAPTAVLARELRSPGSAAKAAPTQPDVSDQGGGDDGWFFERTPNGFRFRWNFRWSFGS
jgi:S1-C subfamily serine protease